MVRAVAQEARVERSIGLRKHGAVLGGCEGLKLGRFVAIQLERWRSRRIKVGDAATAPDAKRVGALVVRLFEDGIDVDELAARDVERGDVVWVKVNL